MSAIDISIGIDRQKDRNGDRVKVVLFVKYLP